MHSKNKTVLLISLPFADISIPSIQLSVLEGYLKERNIHATTRHLYLKAAEIFGLQNYKLLTNYPSNPYSAQMSFSKFIFPEHWQKIKSNVEEHLFDSLDKKIIRKTNFNFNEYLNKTDLFYECFFNTVDWKSYDIIGFTINYGQLLPSLAITKRIKEMNPDKWIIFGGSSTVDKLGYQILQAFEFIDFIITGNGEEPLFQLASNFDNYESIPGLIYRKDSKVFFNDPNKSFNFNDSPILSYDTFFQELDLISNSFRQHFNYYGRLPIEFSRGCWWNKCTFCNQSIHHPCYVEKQIDRIIEELITLSDKYKILSFQIMDATLSKHNYKSILERIIKLDRDFTFYAEARPGYLNSEDYRLLQKAGFTYIQSGIESFSNNYLKKMDKGNRVIDNIATLKFCREYGITNGYNIVVNYPNEDEIDFKESVQTIQLIKSYLEPPQISQLIIEYGSPIYNNPQKFMIDELTHTKVNKIVFPEEYLEKKFTYSYKYIKNKESSKNNWNQLIDDWKKERENRKKEAITSNMTIDDLIFFYVDGKNFLKIYDKRKLDDIKIFTLDKKERDVFLSCRNIISYEELQSILPQVQDYELTAILQTFEQNGIIFCEDDHYLNLPLSYKLITNQLEKKESRQLLYNSGIQRSL